MKKLLSVILALCMCLSLTAFASAAEITSSGGSATSPISLTTTNSGLNAGDDDVAPTKLSVIVPTSLPMAMSDDGTVVTATDCRIINHSFGAVRVSSVTLNAINGWKLTAFGDKSTLAGEKVDSNKLGFSISIGGGERMVTDRTNAATQKLISAPIAGCYMTGVGDSRNNSAAIDYDAIVTPLSDSMRNAVIANIVIVVEWDIAD